MFIYLFFSLPASYEEPMNISHILEPLFVKIVSFSSFLFILFRIINVRICVPSNLHHTYVNTCYQCNPISVNLFTNTPPSQITVKRASPRTDFCSAHHVVEQQSNVFSRLTPWFSSIKKKKNQNASETHLLYSSASDEVIVNLPNKTLTIFNK